MTTKIYDVTSETTTGHNIKEQMSIQGQSIYDPGAILKLAIERGASVDVMERLLEMQTKIRAEQAKEAFNRAMAAFQAQCPIIVKRKAGAKEAYKYAPLDDIVTDVKDLLRIHGFSYRITSEVEPGWVKALCHVTHIEGHCEVSEFKVPIDSKNPMMSEPQRFGGARTFAMRYAFTGAFGILTADEDTDAADRREKQNVPIERTVGPQRGEKSMKAKVWAEAGPKFGNATGKFYDWLKGKGLIQEETENLSQITESEWTKILPHVEALEFGF